MSQSLGGGCCHGSGRFCSGPGEAAGQEPWGSPCPRAGPAASHTPSRCFPASVEKRERKSQITATRCGIPPSVLEKKAQEEVREPGKMSEVIFFFFFMLFQFGSSGCVFGPALVLKKKGCRKSL